MRVFEQVGVLESRSQHIHLQYSAKGRQIRLLEANLFGQLAQRLWREQVADMTHQGSLCLLMLILLLLCCLRQNQRVVIGAAVSVLGRPLHGRRVWKVAGIRPVVMMRATTYSVVSVSTAGLSLSALGLGGRVVVSEHSV